MDACRVVSSQQDSLGAGAWKLYQALYSHAKLMRLIRRTNRLKKQTEMTVVDELAET